MKLVPESEHPRRKHFLWLPLRLSLTTGIITGVPQQDRRSPVPSVLRARTQGRDPAPSAPCVLAQHPSHRLRRMLDSYLALAGTPPPMTAFAKGSLALAHIPGSMWSVLVVSSWNSPSIFRPLVLDPIDGSPMGWPLTSLTGKSPPLHCHGPRPKGHTV